MSKKKKNITVARTKLPINNVSQLRKDFVENSWKQRCCWTMRKAGTDLSSRNIKGGVRSRKRGGNPSFTKVPPLNGGETQEAKTSLESKRGKKEGRRGLQRCRVGKKGSKNRPISKGELGNKPERVVPFGIFGGKAALSPLFLAFSWSMAPRKSAWRDRPFAYSSPPSPNSFHLYFERTASISP